MECKAETRQLQKAAMFPSPREEINMYGDHLREGCTEDALGCFSRDLKGQGRVLQKNGCGQGS